MSTDFRVFFLVFSNFFDFSRSRFSCFFQRLFALPEIGTTCCAIALKTHKIYPCKPYSRYTEKVFLNGAVGDKSLITVFPSNWFSMCRLCKQQGRIIDSKNIYVKRFQCFFLKIFDIFLYFYTRPVFVKVIGTDNCLRTHFFNNYSIARARQHAYARVRVII